MRGFDWDRIDGWVVAALSMLSKVPDWVRLPVSESQRETRVQFKTPCRITITGMTSRTYLAADDPLPYVTTQALADTSGSYGINLSKNTVYPSYL